MKLKFGVIIIICIVCYMAYYHNKSLNKDEFIIIEKEFGNYKIPSDWEENSEHSTRTKFFYVKKGDGKKERPNNISVNVGKNNYSKDDHEKFKIAILNQLSIQMSKIKDVVINANGSTTNNEYIVYTFYIYEKSNNIITTQYYIVGNYKYVLVHETTFGASDETDNVARNIVNTFKWKE